MKNQAIEGKKIKMKQKANLNLFLSKMDLSIDDNQLIFTPQSSKILKKIVNLKGEKTNFTSHHVCLSLAEIAKTLSHYNENDYLYLILPNVSLGSEYFETSMPILMIQKWKIQEIMNKINLDNIDFISIFSTDFKSGIIIDGYSDFPCESNNFYDGHVYDYYLIDF